MCQHRRVTASGAGTHSSTSIPPSPSTSFLPVKATHVRSLTLPVDTSKISVFAFTYGRVQTASLIVWTHRTTWCCHRVHVSISGFWSCCLTTVAMEFKVSVCGEVIQQLIMLMMVYRAKFMMLCASKRVSWPPLPPGIFDFTLLSLMKRHNRQSPIFNVCALFFCQV